MLNTNNKIVAAAKQLGNLLGFSVYRADGAWYVWHHDQRLDDRHHDEHDAWIEAATAALRQIHKLDG